MKKILVIGATSMIAEHCARIWSVRGDELYLVGRDLERLKVIVTDLKLRGATETHMYCTDLNRLENHEEILESAEMAMGGIDTVLIAHGRLPNQKVCERNVADALREIMTNALSTVSILTLIANYFEAKRAGTIVVISSVAGDRGRSSNYVYGSAKALVNSFASGLRQRLHRFNVSVITIKPGFVNTPMTSGLKKGILWAEPDRVAIRIVKAIDNRRDEVYVPISWRLIIFIVLAIPNNIFKRLKL